MRFHTVKLRALKRPSGVIATEKSCDPEVLALTDATSNLS
jgi:hypothetical protein